MSPVWWERASLNRVPPGGTDPPLLSRGGRAAVRQEVAGRRTAFTPEWTRLQAGDAGDALLNLHAELAEPLVQRLNRLPYKTRVEALRAAGVQAVPARPARALLAFTVSDAAPRSALIPRGFQVSASAADGSGATVIFETERTLYAAPGKIEACYVQEGRRFFQVDLDGSDPNTAVQIFGAAPKPGSALLLGLSTAIEPHPSLSLGLQLSAESGAPPPVAAGGVEPAAVLPRPFLRWAFFDGGSFETAEIIKDETNSLLQSGVVELRTPKRWRAGTPAGVGEEKPLRWLRLAVVHGDFTQPPELAFVRLNLVPAVAARTMRNEVLEYVPGSDGRNMRLSQKPVLAGSLQLSVNEGAITPVGRPATTESDSGPADGLVTWHAVDDLNAHGPDDRVYVLDAATGEVRFGDGVHGATLPSGFRHVVAQSYQVATGSAGAVEAEAVTGLISSVPFLTAVTNPLPASGGRDEEEITQTLVRGPEQIRARKRAVTMADYELLALQVSGADVRRAHAVAAMHADFNNAGVPGAVTVYLVGPPTAQGPPYPDQGSLEAVSRFLAQDHAPAGVEVVAAAPLFHSIGVRASLVIAPGADDGGVIRRTLEALDDYFDPITGGDQATGWPFGGTVHHHAVVRMLLFQVENLLAVSALNLMVDGTTMSACSDFKPATHALLWPDTHELRVVEETGK